MARRERAAVQNHHVSYVLGPWPLGKVIMGSAAMRRKSFERTYLHKSESWALTSRSMQINSQQC